MKNYRQTLTITTETEEEFLNLTFEIEECVRRSNISDGIVYVGSLHTTSSVFLDNDNEALQRDWRVLLNKLVDPKAKREFKADEEKSDCNAHLKHLIFGSGVTVGVSDGHLDLGAWQYIMYGDFSGEREKQVLVKIIGE